MKGHTLERKLRKLSDEMADCMEIGQELLWEELYTHEKHTKKLKRLSTKIDKVGAKYNNLVRHM